MALADVPAGAARSAWWAKAGTAAQWKAFVADENDNGWSGWFDVAANVTTAYAAKSATGANGGVLEATIDLAQLYGTLPTRIGVAAVAYANANAGALRTAQQVPASVDQNGNLDAAEYLTLELCSLATTGCCPADLDASGAVDGADLGRLLSAWGTPGASADLDHDGAVNGADLGLLLSAWGACGR
jgi:hypothetical protein